MRNIFTAVGCPSVRSLSALNHAIPFRASAAGEALTPRARPLVNGKAHPVAEDRFSAVDDVDVSDGLLELLIYKSCRPEYAAAS